MLDNWILEQMGALIRIDSTLTTPEHAKERANICYTINNGKACKSLTKVSPIPGMKVDGCGECKCPIKSKAMIWDKYREENKSGEPLNIIEILESVKRKNTDGLIKDRMTCPKKLWQEVDLKFEKIYQ